MGKPEYSCRVTDVLEIRVGPIEEIRHGWRAFFHIGHISQQFQIRLAEPQQSALFTIRKNSHAELTRVRKSLEKLATYRAIRKTASRPLSKLYIDIEMDESVDELSHMGVHLPPWLK